ncbi:MAG: carbon-nitrogen hydrolase family protein [Cyclobacteriaceae bacterium]
MEKYVAAVIQDAPVLFDLAKTIEKTADLVHEASSNNARLILFPEAFIPAYPRGLSFGTNVGSRNEAGRELWRLYNENSLNLSGKEFSSLSKMAKSANAFLVIGVIEKEPISSGTLYCTTLYFGPDGNLLGKHRKLKPTASERIIWGEGDGSTLDVFDTSIGKLGGLICWENYMPLARMAMYQQGVQVYMTPTADQRETWQTSMRHIACEGRCYVLSANQYVTKNMYPEHVLALEQLEPESDVLCRGGSVIVDPMGNVIAGPLFDESGIIYSELSLKAVIASRMDFDVCGHYSRNDIFELKINRTGH